MEGEILRLRDIEMGVEQMSRLQSQDAKSNLLPAKEFGVTDLEVQNQQTKPYQFVVNLDNHGSSSTGEYQLSGDFIWDNPLDLNDKLSIGLNGTSRQSYGKATRGNSFSYQIPYGYNTFSLSYSKFKYQQYITGLNETFRSTGTSSTYRLAIDRIIHRNKNSKTKINLSLARKKNRNFIEDILIGVSSRKLSIATMSLGHSRLFSRGSVNINISRHEGIRSFRAEENLGGDNPKAQFLKYSFDVDASYQFKGLGKIFTFRPSFHAQETQDDLYGTEHISIGSIYTVRGFDEFSISGNKGWYSRNELSFTTSAEHLGEVHPYVSFDIGRIKSDRYGTTSGKLSGRTIGIRTKGKYINWDISWSHGNENPSSFSNQIDKTTFRASVSVVF